MSLQQIQYAFAAHIRDPQRNPRPADVEERRMQVYREVFYNNITDFMANTYPVLHSILGEARWDEILRDYFARHLSHTPLFPEMPREFLKYLEQEYQPHDDDHPFMLELAHYEWVELALDMSDQDIGAIDHDPRGDLVSGIPVVSPLAWPLSYQYPVHQLSNAYLPSEPPEQATHIIVYRDRGDEVHFLEVNPMTLRLVRLLQDSELSGAAALQQLAQEINHPQPDTLLDFGGQLLADLQQRDIILGTRS